jgi:hypothetical protein
MVMSCSENAWIMRVGIRLGCGGGKPGAGLGGRIVGAGGRQALVDFGADQTGLEIRAVICSQTAASSGSARTGLLVQTRPMA